MMTTRILRKKFLGFHKFSALIKHQNFSNESTLESSKFQCFKLAHRGVIKASGKDVSTFLQGLITNDMGCLDTKCDIKSIFAMLLNLQGRILYDMIIYKVENDAESETKSYFIECDKEMISDVISTVNRYRLRKKVDLSDLSDEMNVWAICPETISESQTSFSPETLNEKDIVTSCIDPRVKCFGSRMILPPGINGASVIKNSEDIKHMDNYHKRRYQFGIGEGPTDMPPGNSLPLECNAVFMNGVSFNKGCYIGQELTARTHHTGVIRKRLMPVQLHGNSDKCKPGYTIENLRGKNCGKMRGSIHEDGIALLRVEEALGCELSVLDSDKHTVGTLSSWIPHWWPRDSDAVVTKARRQINREESTID